MGANEAADGDPLFDADLAARLGDREQARTAYLAIIDKTDGPNLVAKAQIGLGLVSAPDSFLAQSACGPRVVSDDS